MDDETLVRPDSPFLKSRPHIDKRPKLRFKSPKQTEEWLASREKTDYTYSRSASYSELQAQKSLHIISNNYPTPIMSRRSHGGVYTRDETSSTSSLVTGGTRRTSARIAARQGLPQIVSDVRTPSRNAYTGYSESITTTTVYTDDGSIMCDEVDSSVSSLSSVRGRLFTNEQYADKQLDHLYVCNH
ncbi:uncharacterized protein LOC117103796 [Anneissia japonica]|uniref:uncharacterized protein LOC117103796 n=1 Tax=Anneissia japonica TaxID=1529436 RepID=UPI0014255E64|nr:uncharacterized protein LOC117103796 [Anneissia japonica]